MWWDVLHHSCHIGDWKYQLCNNIQHVRNLNDEYFPKDIFIDQV